MSASEDDAFSTPPPAASAKKCRPSVAQELSKLNFKKQNQSMAKLRPSLTVVRRPLIHPPIASPFAGRGVQKVVYVSRNTPIMSAIKRVKKLLLHVEKRALQDVDLAKDRNGMRKLAEANEKLGKESEEVLVKASGRAMEQALRVGEWFRNREDELACKVEVHTGSVQAIDDIVQKEDDTNTMLKGEPGYHETSTALDESHDTSLISSSGVHESSMNDDFMQLGPDQNTSSITTKPGHAEPDGRPQKRQRRRKRKKEALDEETSARIRWVKTVEVVISLKA